MEIKETKKGEYHRLMELLTEEEIGELIAASGEDDGEYCSFETYSKISDLLSDIQEKKVRRGRERKN